MTTPAAEWVATDLDLRHNQLINARPENRSTAPPDPVKGQLWFDTSTTPNQLKYWNGAAWTGGRAYNIVADDGAARAQRTRLDFRSTGSVAATVTDDGFNDTSAVTLDAKFGPVAPSTIPGAAAVNGTATTVARSDHNHGAPAEDTANTRLTTWWQYDRELWEQLDAPATFIAELPEGAVGGGWQVGTNGSVYWRGDPIPVAVHDVYVNSARVTATGASTVMSMGWMCYGGDHQLLGRVRCNNRVPIVPANETGVLVARNLVPSPSGETGSASWKSVSTGGDTNLPGVVAYSTDRTYTGSKSIKVTWRNLGVPATHSTCVIECPTPVPPSTPVTLSAQIYVPGGSPDVRLHYADEGVQSPLISQKSQWVYVEVPWTTPSDGGDQVLTVGIYTNTPIEGTTAYLDNVMLRIGHGPLPEGRTYFDGDTISTEEDETFVWDGAVHNSTSSYYTGEPSWEDVLGHIAIGEGDEPEEGKSTEMDEAVNPLPGTIYFRPFISCEYGQILVDNHEVSRSPRELQVLDELRTGWLTSEGPITAPGVVTLNLSPPDTTTVVPMRIGPVQDPPAQGGDAVPRSYVDRGLGLLPEETAVPPQFLWSGAPGVDPQPADLGFPFTVWPMFSQWLDTSVKQSQITVLTGTYAGAAAQATPLRTGWGSVQNTYRLVTTVPADGVLIGISHGACSAVHADYVLLRSAIWTGVDESGVGGSYAGWGGETIVSGSTDQSAAPRTPYTTFSVAMVTAGTRCMARVEYNHGGPSASVNRERTLLIYLPGATRLGSA